MGTLTLTFLGTGTSLGVPIIGCNCEVCSSNDLKDKRLRTSALIQTDKGCNILLDCGPDFRYQMLREGVSRLDAVLITHEHRDHTAGLDDLRAYNYIQKRPTDIYANSHAIEGMHRMYYYVFENFKYPGVPKFILHEIDAHKCESFNVSGVDIVPLEVMHANLPVLAYRIGSLAYITDAKTIEGNEERKLQGVDTLVVNALRRDSHFSHFTLDEALALIDRVRPRVAYLTHISHEMGLYDKVTDLPSNVHMAYDGLRISASY